MNERIVLVVDKTTARIFSCKGRPPVLHPITSLANAEGRLRNRDLDTDAGGRMFDDGRPNKSAFQPRVSPVEASLMRFFKQVTEQVEPLTRSGPIDLVLVAGPKIRGHMRKELESIKMLSIVAEIDKDLSEQRPEEIAEYVGRELI